MGIFVCIIAVSCAVVVLVGKIVFSLNTQSPKRYYEFALNMKNYRSYSTLSKIQKEIANRVLFGVEFYFEKTGETPLGLKRLCDLYKDGNLSDEEFESLVGFVKESLSKVPEEKILAAIK